MCLILRLATRNCTIHCTSLALTSCAMRGWQYGTLGITLPPWRQHKHSTCNPELCVHSCAIGFWPINENVTSKVHRIGEHVCISNWSSWLQGESYICAEGSRDVSKLALPFYEHCLNLSSVFGGVLLCQLLTELGSPTLSLRGLNFTVNFWTRSNLQYKCSTMWATQCTLDFLTWIASGQKAQPRTWQSDLH